MWKGFSTPHESLIAVGLFVYSLVQEVNDAIARLRSTAALGGPILSLARQELESSPLWLCCKRQV